MCAFSSCLSACVCVRVSVSVFLCVSVSFSLKCQKCECLRVCRLSCLSPHRTKTTSLRCGPCLFPGQEKTKLIIFFLLVQEFQKQLRYVGECNFKNYKTNDPCEFPHLISILTNFDYHVSFSLCLEFHRLCTHCSYN